MSAPGNSPPSYTAGTPAGHRAERPTERRTNPERVEPEPFSDTLQDLVLDSPDIGAFLEGLSLRAGATLSRPDAEVHRAVLLVRPRVQATMAGSNPEARAMDSRAMIQLGERGSQAAPGISLRRPCR
jgi:hypothetical protein